MENADDRVGRIRVRKNRSQAERMECRQCEAICERVVSPWRCLKSRYSCVYAYDQGDTTYFGCLHKVFSPELDLGAFEGEGSGGEGGTDPYGPIRAARPPRAHCPAGIERAYGSSGISGGCANPAFVGGVCAAQRGGGGALAQPGPGWFPDTQG